METILVVEVLLVTSNILHLSSLLTSKFVLFLFQYSYIISCIVDVGYILRGHICTLSSFAGVSILHVRKHVQNDNIKEIVPCGVVLSACHMAVCSGPLGRC